MLDLLIWGIVIVSSIWVLIDARSIGVQKGQIRGIANMGPVAWFFVCLLLWIVGFPMYLTKRPEYKRVNGKSGSNSLPTLVGVTAIAAVVLSIVLTAACGQTPATTDTNAASAQNIAPLQCGKDTDCKGDRICDDGKCVAPSSNGQSVLQEQPTPASTAAASAASPTENPKFKDYPAPPLYSGRPAKLLLDSDFAKEYRSRLTEAMSEAPVFAGEYVVTGWGCGSGGCYVQALVNKRTGKAIETTFGAHNVTVDFENFVEERVGEEIEAMKVDSRLLVTQEVTEDDEGNPHEYFAKFYVVDNGQLKLIKKVAIPKPAPEAS